MKKMRFLLLAALVAMFASCQKEETVEQGSGKDKPTPTGDTRIIIEGEGMIDVATRSSDGKVNFTGGYATGAGLYDKDDQPEVEAHPDAGYEVNYFYGGPADEPQRYDYAQSSASLFNVRLNGQDHTFHCGFKEKKRELTVNAGTGGSVSPSGTSSYRVEKAISITATPGSGYEFSGWTVISGDVTIENPSSPATTATLHNSSGVILAEFVKNGKFMVAGDNGYILTSMDGEYWSSQQVGSNHWTGIAYGNGKYVAVGYFRGVGYMTTSTDGTNWTTPQVTKLSITNSSDGSYRTKRVLNSIIYANGQFVAVGNDGIKAYSTDGINWAFMEFTSVASWKSIAFGNGKYVAVGDGGETNYKGYVTSSTDGINWENTKNISPIYVRDVTYGNGQFVAVGSTNYVYYSNDGITWNAMTNWDDDNDWKSVTFKDWRIIAVGSRGKIFVTTDINNFRANQIIQVGEVYWKSIIYANRKLIAVSQDGFVTTSMDGMNWTTPKQIKDGNGKPIDVNAIVVIPNS